MNKKLSIRILVALLVLTSLFFLAGQNNQCGRDSGKPQSIPQNSNLLSEHRIKYSCWGKIDQVTGVILHYTATNDFESAIRIMENRELFVQIMIDKDGNAYQLTDNLDDFSAGATGGNSWGINIEIVGTKDTLEQSAKNNDAQFQSVIATIKFLSKFYNIPITNEFDHNEKIWHGIFSHQQVDNFHPTGGRRNKKDPGEKYMSAVMTALLAN